MARSGRSSTIQSSFGRATAVRFPVSESLLNIILFQTHRPTYFSFIRMVWMVETAQPRRMGPRRVTFAGKGTPSAFSRTAMAFMLGPSAYMERIRRTTSASGSHTTHPMPSWLGEVRYPNKRPPVLKPLRARPVSPRWVLARRSSR